MLCIPLQVAPQVLTVFRLLFHHLGVLAHGVHIGVHLDVCSVLLRVFRVENERDIEEDRFWAITWLLCL